MKYEYGRIGQYRYSGMFFEEFLPELRGTRGVQTYYQMSENDDTVGAILFAIQMLMRQVDFTIEPGGPSDIDKAAAEFVESCLYDMANTWQDTLAEILSFLTYGWSYHEICYKRRNGRKRDPDFSSKFDDGLIGWSKLPIRAQDTLFRWEYKPGTDVLLGMSQMPPPDFGVLTIPLEKALHFRTTSVKNNPEGRSILRTAYKSWYFKSRIQEIEGIGIERNLAGFPVLYTPPNMNLWDPDDKESQEALSWARDIVTGIKQDSEMGIVLPGGEGGWKLELLHGNTGKAIDTNAVIERYDKRIATTVLADFVMLGQQSVGSFALASSKTKIFALAVGTYLDVICDVFNSQGIPRLIDLNGKAFSQITDYPHMVHGDIEDKDLAVFGEFLQRVSASGIIQPDEQIEDYVRRVAGLPSRLETESSTADLSIGRTTEPIQTEQGAVSPGDME